MRYLGQSLRREKRYWPIRPREKYIDVETFTRGELEKSLEKSVEESLSKRSEKRRIHSRKSKKR
jgi:hypothetical protein